MSFGLGGAPTLAPANPGGRAPVTNPLVALITALGQLPQIRMQQQMGQAQLQREQTQNKYADQMAQLDMQTQRANLAQQQRQNDQQDWQMLSQTMLRNPAAASNQFFKQRAQEVAQRLGIPLEMDATGNIDPNQFLKSSSEVDPKIMMQIAALPPGEQRINAARLLGVKLTHDEAYAKAAISPKDQAAISRWQAEGLHWATDDKIKAQRAQFQNDYDEARTTGNWAKISEMQQELTIKQQNADSATMRAQAEAFRAQTYAQRALQASGGRANVGQTLAKSFFLKAQGQLVTAKRNMDAALAALDDAAAHNTDPDTMNTYSVRFKAAQAAYNSSVDAVHDAQTLLDENYPQAQSVRAQSGARNVTVETLPDSKKSTNPATYTVNNQTYYLHTDGKYYTTPE